MGINVFFYTRVLLSLPFFCHLVFGESSCLCLGYCLKISKQAIIACFFPLPLGAYTSTAYWQATRNKSVKRTAVQTTLLQPGKCGQWPCQNTPGVDNAENHMHVARTPGDLRMCSFHIGSYGNTCEDRFARLAIDESLFVLVCVSRI